MYFINLFCVLFIFEGATAGSRIVFPDDPASRRGKEIDTGITPPKLPVIAHLENDPSTLYNNGTESKRTHFNANDKPLKKGGVSKVDSRFGFSHGFDVSPNNDGGITASFGHSVSGLAGNAQAASHSLSFGLNNGFQASQSASQSNSFNHGFVGNSFSGSQASSQSSSISAGHNGISSSSAAASAAALAGNGGLSASAANSQSASSGHHGHSQSAGSSFGAAFNGGSLSGSQSSSSSSFDPLTGLLNSFIGGGSNNVQAEIPYDQVNFGEGNLDIRHRGLGNKRQHAIVETSIVFPAESTGSKYQQYAVHSEANRWRRPQNNRRNNEEVYVFEI